MEEKKFKQLKRKIEKGIKDLMKFLKKKKIFLATMESCTGGALINAITNIPGASEITKGGIVAYSDEQKIFFGVSKDLIEKFSVYSPEVATAMAKLAQKNFNSQIGIGITGVLSRKDPKNPKKKVGQVDIAIAFNKKILARRFFFPPQKDREQDKALVIWQTLEMIKEILKGN
jgi:PncC family amidohydrolase